MQANLSVCNFKLQNLDTEKHRIKEGNIQINYYKHYMVLQQIVATPLSVRQMSIMDGRRCKLLHF